MNYKVKSRYQIYYDGQDSEEAYQVLNTLKQGGMTNIRMTPDLSARGFVTDFVVIKNKLIFNNDFADFSPRAFGEDAFDDNVCSCNSIFFLEE